MKKYIKVLKIAIGSSLAIIIANYFSLLYSVSAGIITLLTLQDTKKETFFIALKRIVAFIISYILVLVVFKIFGFNPIAFGIFLLLFTGICIKFRFQESIPMNAVLATHFLLEKSTSFEMLKNEAFILLIGTGIGIIFNLYIPSNIKKIKKKQQTIERILKDILNEMAIALNPDIFIDMPSVMEKQSANTYENRGSANNLESLKFHIEKGISYAYDNINNTFFKETEYFMQYMQLRKRQHQILVEINEKINSITQDTKSSKEVGLFIRKIAMTLSEFENAKGLLELLDDLLIAFKESELPKTREEFENRAVLYVILMNFKIFLDMKKNFVEALSKEQIEIYWLKI